MLDKSENDNQSDEMSFSKHTLFRQGYVSQIKISKLAELIPEKISNYTKQQFDRYTAATCVLIGC